MNESSVLSTSGFLPWIELGDFRIQTYFVVISAVLCLIAMWIPRRAEVAGMDARFALDLFIAAMFGGLLGSRFLHVVWEEPEYYFESPTRVFDFMSGGFVWYGGAIGAFLVLIATVFFRTQKTTGRRRRKRDLLVWLDFFAPITAVGYAGGRLACLLTGCCFGRICEWPFSGAGRAAFFRFPTQGFAVLWELGVAIFLLRSKRFESGQLFFLWLALHGLGRILMESFRADPRGPSVGLATISMIISVAILLTGLIGYRKTATIG